METLHGWGQSQLNKGREECELLQLCISKGRMQCQRHHRIVPKCHTPKTNSPWLGYCCHTAGTQANRHVSPGTKSFSTFHWGAGAEIVFSQKWLKGFPQERQQWNPEVVFRRIPGCFKLSWDTHHGYSGLRWPPRASLVVSVEQTQTFHHDLPQNMLLFTWHPAQHLTFPYTSLLLLQPRAQHQPPTASSISVTCNDFQISFPGMFNYHYSLLLQILIPSIRGLKQTAALPWST